MSDQYPSTASHRMPGYHRPFPLPGATVPVPARPWPAGYRALTGEELLDALGRNRDGLEPGNWAALATLIFDDWVCGAVGADGVLRFQPTAAAMAGAL